MKGRYANDFNQMRTANQEDSHPAGAARVTQNINSLRLRNRRIGDIIVT